MIEEFSNELKLYKQIVNLFSSLDIKKDLAVNEWTLKFLLSTYFAVQKAILQGALLNDYPIEIFDRNDDTYYYVRTKNISDELHNEIMNMIKSNKSITDITYSLENKGYKLLEDIIII